MLTDDNSGNRKQTNLLLQATAKAKFGVNWGESRLKDGVAANDLRSNSNVTAGLYYGLTKSVTLVDDPRIQQAMTHHLAKVATTSRPGHGLEVASLESSGSPTVRA